MSLAFATSGVQCCVPLGYSHTSQRLPLGCSRLVSHHFQQCAAHVLCAPRAHCHDGLSFRAPSQLATTVKRRRPDVSTAYLSSRLASQARNLLLTYRVGYGENSTRPADAETTPSTGLIGVYLMLQVLSPLPVAHGKHNPVSRRGVEIPSFH